MLKFSPPVHCVNNGDNCSNLFTLLVYFIHSRVRRGVDSADWSASALFQQLPYRRWRGHQRHAGPGYVYPRFPIEGRPDDRKAAPRQGPYNRAALSKPIARAASGGSCARISRQRRTMAA